MANFHENIFMIIRGAFMVILRQSPQAQAERVYTFNI